MIGTSPRYVTLSDLRRYISANSNMLGTDEDQLLANCIVSAEGQIDDYTRRNFVAEVGTRYYSRWVSRGMVKETALYFEDGVELFALPQNGTVYGADGRFIPVGSIWLEPRNAGPPFKNIRLYSPYVWSWNTDQEIAIPGTWGFSLSAPPPIQFATLELATYIYRSKDNGPGEVAGFDQAGNQMQPRGIPENVRRKIEPYRSRSGGRL